MKQYLQLLSDVFDNGQARDDRTGTGTRSVFARQARFDLSNGFPLLTTKKIHFKSVVHELLWFLRGDTNIKYLNDNGVRIWDEWADANGDLGPIYGKQWVSWESPEGPINQIAQVIDSLKNSPSSRRHIVSAWNVPQLPRMKLPPCHVLFQFYVQGDKLSCQLYQRSADVFLGVPYNIASYSLLTILLGHVTGLQPHEFVHTYGDIHLYNNHLEQAQLQLTREPRRLPSIRINPLKKDIFDIQYEDIELVDYDPYPTIPAKVSA